MVGVCLALAAVVGAGCAPSSVEPPAADPGESWAIHGVSVVPMDRNGILKDRTVVVAGGVIADMGPTDEVEIPEGFEVIDGSGRFLMPGLWDVHVHLAKDDALALYLANGVTTIVNLDGRQQHLERRAELASGEMEGPRLLTCGPILFGDRVTRDEAVTRVGEIVEEGYDCVKIYSDWEPETYAAASAAAREADALFMGHAPRNLPFDVVLEDGRQQIVHLEELVYTTELDDWLDRWRDDQEITPEDDPRITLEETVRELAKRVAAAGTWVVATEVVIDNYLLRSSEAGRAQLAARPYLQYVHPLTRRAWREEDLGGRHTRFRQQVALQHLMLEIFREEGVRMAAGTDAALPEGLQVVPGWSLHEELGILQATGSTPYQALRQATRDAATFMGREGEGMIKPGARADLLLLDGNPLEDLSHAATPVAVVTEGAWTGRERLDEKLAVVAGRNETYEAEAAQLDDYWGEDAQSLAAAFREIEAPSEELSTFIEQRINRTGYTLVAEENMEAAIAAFAANVETFPESANCYDSLAEAYLTTGDRESAITWYRKALEVDPTFTNAADMLRQIGVEP
jgi:hypothetical protein